jgi:hypothetical protein
MKAGIKAEHGAYPNCLLVEVRDCPCNPCFLRVWYPNTITNLKMRHFPKWIALACEIGQKTGNDFLLGENGVANFVISYLGTFTMGIGRSDQLLLLKDASRLCKAEDLEIIRNVAEKGANFHDVATEGFLKGIAWLANHDVWSVRAMSLLLINRALVTSDCSVLGKQAIFAVFCDHAVQALRSDTEGRVRERYAATLIDAAFFSPDPGHFLVAILEEIAPKFTRSATERPTLLGDVANIPLDDTSGWGCLETHVRCITAICAAHSVSLCLAPPSISSPQINTSPLPPNPMDL